MLKNRSEEFEIIYFIQSKKSMETFHGYKVVEAEEVEYSQFDILVIVSDIYYQEIIEHLKNLDDGCNLCRKAVNYKDLLLLKWENAREIMPFLSCKVRGKKYVVASEDRHMPDYMFTTGVNYAENLINTFFQLVTRYSKRDVIQDRGYF